MNKKMLLPLLALAILPLLAIEMPGNDADRMGKQFAADNPGATIGASVMEEALTEKQEIQRAQLIIEGTIVEAKSYWEMTGEDTIPKVLTEFTVKVSDIIKGRTDGDTVKVVMTGGTLDGITMKTDAVRMESGDRVILLLGKDINSVFGDAYSPLSVTRSIYIIQDDGQAINKWDERSGDKDEVKKRISDRLV